MSETRAALPYILGLDLGCNSLGWVALSASDTILGLGSRVFEAGVEGDIAQGRDESRAVARRQARQIRRTLWRRRKRLVKTFGLLQRAGLLPECAYHNPKNRHEKLVELDQELARKHLPPPAANETTGDKARRVARAQVIPYYLRARALEQKLEPCELGRALYSLAQRRGFISNRRTPKKPDEELSTVYSGIEGLRARLGTRTLGQYFASLDPQDTEKQKLRRQWTHRDMYTAEFERIWQAQRVHHPALQDEKFKKQVWRAMFFQRPLKNQKDLRGKCELERTRCRAPWAYWAAQRFRLLQRANDLRIKLPEGGERPLADEERRVLVAELEARGDLEFPKIRTLLGLSKKHKFSHEVAGETKLSGNRTTAALRPIFGAQWDDFTETQRDEVVEEWLSIQKDDALARRGKKLWDLSDEQAAKFGKVGLQEDFCNLSRRAIAKLLPDMEAGMAYMTARKKHYPETFAAAAPLEALPPVRAALPELRNPAVMRALTELRKVVNALVRKFGKPALVRVELARDLKNPRKRREEIWKKNRDNQTGRDKARSEIAKFLEIRRNKSGVG